MNMPKFDTRSKSALAKAQQAAIQLGHAYIGSEHLLFGILSENQQDLPFQLALMGETTADDLLEIIKKYHNKNFASDKSAIEPSQDKLLPDVTQEFQSSLDNAIRSAEKYQYEYIGIEHLVYGVLTTENSNGVKLMNLDNETKKKLTGALEIMFTENQINGGNITESEEVKNHEKRSRKKVSALQLFSVNLNEKLKKDTSFKLVERELETDRLIEILSRKNKNNPIILGEAGVGKTALIEGLANRINNNKVPAWLKNKTVYDLDIASMLAGSVFRGEFEQRVKAIIEEVSKNGDAIIFIDEIHNTIGAGGGGAGDKGPDMSSLLKPALARGEFSVIGATTEDEYRKIIKKDKAFERRFQPIHLDEPSKEQTIKIIKGVKKIYEVYHGVEFPEDYIDKLVDLADRFLPERKFPDKALDILDECLVKAKINLDKNLESSTGWEKIEHELLDLINQKNSAILNKDEETSKKLEKKQKTLEKKLEKINSTNQKNSEKSQVTLRILEEVISKVSGVPLVRISSDIYTQIKDLEKNLKREIFGQDDAINRVALALKRSYAGVNPNKGPIASFLLLGPTGVGKTETVKVLTRDLYGDPNKYLLKIDMSEMKEKHSLSRLLGAPAGYVGYDDAPQLTEFLRKRPYSVILFDEIEKGHPDNLNILLQMLDEGVVSDAKGNKYSCENTIIFLTSNLGKNQFNRFAAQLGFAEEDNREKEDYEQLKKQINADVEKNIKPEILGRLTDKIIYRPITKSVLKQIVSKELANLQNHMFRQGRTVTFSDHVIEIVANTAKEKFDYGAREIRNLVAEKVQNPLAEFLLSKPKSSLIKVETKAEEIVVK